MRLGQRKKTLVGSLSVFLAGMACPWWITVLPATEPPLSSAVTRAQIEADWLLQDLVRNLPAVPEEARRKATAGATTQQDAAGGCDGVIDGTYGFHTGCDAQPWWQVDLGEVIELGEIAVFNRCDSESHRRAVRLRALLSCDGVEWSPLYTHDGTPFLGHPDDRPLRIAAAGQAARYVRLTLDDTQYFHLDEVQIFTPAGDRNIALGKAADQSSISAWSRSRLPNVALAPQVDTTKGPSYPVAEVIERGAAAGR